MGFQNSMISFTNQKSNSSFRFGCCEVHSIFRAEASSWFRVSLLKEPYNGTQRRTTRDNQNITLFIHISALRSYGDHYQNSLKASR